MSLNGRQAMVLAIGLLLGWSVPGLAQRSLPPLPKGVTPHHQPVDGGRIDWADGAILVKGIGKAQGVSAKDEAMARRSAELIDLRNALLIAAGLSLDGQGRLKDLDEGVVEAGGTIKGHQIIQESWHPDRRPPECVAEVRVPLWGVEGLAAKVSNSHREGVLRIRRARLKLVAGKERVSPRQLLIIDARGTGLRPCLFPAVVDNDNAVLYDCGTVTKRMAHRRPLVRYVETALSARELSRDGAAAFRSTDAAAQPGQCAAPPVFCGPPDATSQPDPPPAGEAAGVRLVHAVKAGGAGNTEIVLSKADALALSTSPVGANLLREGRVLVIVDPEPAAAQPESDAR